MLLSKKTPKRIIAIVLSLVLLLSAVPMGVFSAFAQQQDEFIVILDGYNESATVTLTQSDDVDVSLTVTADNGKAVFEKFCDDEKTYNLKITDLIGYEDYEDFSITITGNSYTVNLVEIKKITIIGTVIDENESAKEDVKISYSAYEGKVTGETKTDTDGKYSFEAYSGVEYELEIDAGDKYYSYPTTVKEVADKELDTYKLEVKQFTITTSAGSNGNVSAPIVTVNYGDDAPSIIISAEPNYRIEEIIINGQAVPAAVGEETYDISSEIKNVKENYTVTASFYRPTYEITINYNSNGEVKDNSDNPVSNGGKVILEEGAEAGFTAIPNANYHIGNISIDGVDVEEQWSNDYGDYSQTFNDNKSHTVTITFTINTFFVSVSKNDNGSVFIDSEVTDKKEFDYDSNITILVVPNDGYDIDTFTVSSDGSVDVSSLTEKPEGYVYTINNITEDVIIDVMFKAIANASVSDPLDNDYYKVTFSKDPVVIGDKYIVAKGETMTIEPKDPYKRIRFSNSIFAEKFKEFTTDESREITYIGLSDNEIIGGWKIDFNVNINFVVDENPPEISENNIVKNPNVEYHNSSYEISVPVTDDIAGVDYVLYSTTNDINAGIKANYDAGTNTATFTTTDGEFNGLYYIWAVDKVGNASVPSTVEIKIDKTAPTVTSVVLSGDNLKVTQFGTYSNNDIKVTVKADDDESKVAKSEVDTITLFVDGIEYGTEKVDSKGEAEFTLTNSNGFDFSEGKALSIIAKDKAGNPCEPVSINDVAESTNKDSDIVTITTVTPTVDIDIDDNGAYEGLVRYDQDKDTVWFNGDNNFTICVKDKFAIQSITVKLNGEEIETTSDGTKLKGVDFTSDGEANTEIELIVNTSQYKNEINQSKDGENILEVYVVNASQNENVPNPERKSVYIDTTRPDITGFEFTVKGRSVIEKILNFLTFGNFFNEIIEIKVSAKDDNASSGIKEITLYGDEIAIGAPQPVVDGVATFVVPAGEITDEKLYLNTTISAKATDNVGNTTAEFVYPTTTNSDTFADSGLMIETIKPTINVDLPKAADNKNSNTADENDWYKDDIDFNIFIKDPDSGIRNVEIKINDRLIETDKDSKNISEEFYKKAEKTTKLEFRVNTDQAIRNDDGSYKIAISVTDNAGNVSELYEKTIYKDVANPAITNFKFEALGYRYDNAVTKTDTNEITAQVTDYGFYFIKDTKVTITAHDAAPTAGVKSITYYTVDKDGGKSEEVTKLVNKNNQISFTVPANFKGQIYAKATDNVGNTPEEFVNPNSAIVESPEQHEKTSSITYTLKDTEYRDSAGNNLYANNTTVDVEIVDSFSGIRQIDWEIVSPYDDKNQAGTITVSNDATVTSVAKEGYSDNCLGEWKSTTENNLVTVLSNTITVSNNSNNIQIKFTLTDRAGNITEDVIQTLSIDKTAPKIVVQMNEDDDDIYNGFFKVNRTVDVYVYERNFRSDDFNFVVTRTDDNDFTSNIDIKSLFKKIGETVIDGAECYVYKMSHTFTADGDYNFKVEAKDFVKNSTVDSNVKYSSNKTTDYSAQNDADRAIDNTFTIDQTAPVVSVSYDNNNVTNGKYYNDFRTATITVTEHNFTAANNRITYTRTSERDGQTIDTPSVSAWSQNGNVYTATIRYGTDGDYTFGIDVMDKAGNEIKDSDVSYPDGREVSKTFTIDTIISEPIIGGVENGKSYKEEVIPTINIDDVNYATSTVQLLRTQKGDINRDVTEQYINNQPANRVTVSEDTFEKTQENDGIYTLSVSVTDMAGNTASNSVTFTVNRFGSVYEYSQDLISLNDTYVQAVTGNIVITEYNPDKLIADSLKVEVTRDGAPISNLDVKVNPVINNTVAIGESGWYQYEYVFANTNFESDGIYTITVASEDEAGNKPESTNDSAILFRVDQTPPDIVSVKGLEEPRVNAVEQEIEYTVYDAIGLKSIVVYINDVPQEPITDFDDLSNYTGSFNVGEGYQNKVQIVVTDLADNKTDTLSAEFEPEYEFNSTITVSTNIFILWYSDKPLFWGSIAGTVVVAGFIIFLIAKKHKKDDEDTSAAQ